MTLISYAQNHEDVLLSRLFPPGATGFYIDVGAYHPTYNSVTRHFYDLGWRGINVEPARVAFERLAALRERDVNLNAGVSDEEGTLTFFESPPETGWSTFEADQAERHREAGIPFEERSVPVTTLARICEDHVEGTIDFLTVDVEGHEHQVLRGGDWKRWRPRVVVVEATQPGTKIPSHEDWEPILLDAEYLFATFDGLNRYYVRAEDSELVEPLRVPVNVLDDYIPYEFARQVEDARGKAQAAENELATARAMIRAYRAESTSFSSQVAFLHAEYKRLEHQHRDLELGMMAGRAQYEAVRAMINDVRGRYEQLSQEIAGARAEVAAAQERFSSVSPAGLAVGRRLTQVSGRFPKTGEVVKRSLRGALAVKRRLPRRGT